MSLAGTLIVENFNYGVGEEDFPLFENNNPLLDEETGEQKTMKFKVLSIEAQPGAYVELRIPADNWDNFLAVLAEKPQIEVADLEDLREVTSV